MAGIRLDKLRYEVGLSELGEWMNLRIYLPEEYSFHRDDGKELALRVECFNSVDGTTRLVILFGWFRFACSNGLIIGEFKIEIKERHVQRLDLSEIFELLRPAFEAVEADRRRMEEWQSDGVEASEVEKWVDSVVSDLWGKKTRRKGFSHLRHRSRR